MYTYVNNLIKDPEDKDENEDAEEEEEPLEDEMGDLDQDDLTDKLGKILCIYLLTKIIKIKE